MAAQISSLIDEADRGDSSAAEALFAVLYSELHQMTKRELGRHSSLVAVTPTTLLHESYLDMAARGDGRFPRRAVKFLRIALIGRGEERFRRAYLRFV